MERDKKKEVEEKKTFKLGVRAMLERRHIKDKVSMYIWMRSQKDLAVKANSRRVEKYQREMVMLEEMIEEEELIENET